MKTIIVLLFMCSTALGQSIVVSGNSHSFAVSGSAPDVTLPATKPAEPEPTKKIVLKPQASVVDEKTDYVVVFTTSNCSPCIQVKNKTIPALRRKNIIVREITDSRIAAEFGITSFPVVMVARNKRELRRWSGFVSAETILQHLVLPPQASSVSPTIHKSVIVSETPFGETLLPRNITISPYGNIDLATYSRTDRRGNACQCGMCLSIYPYQNAYREQQKRLKEYTPVTLEIGQQATPMDLVSSGVSQMKLTPGDFFCDIGCGDGRWLIAASEASGCQAVGIEYDHRLVELARAKITAAGLSDRIQIIEGDARDFDYSSVTAIACHLYDDLLAELFKSGTFSTARVVVTPYHEVPGLQMEQSGGVWIHNR